MKTMSLAILVTAVPLCLAHVQAEAQPAPYAGRRVVDVLGELQAKGLVIIFSSSLVPDTLLVKSEPRAQIPRDIAVEILAPHGLALQEGPGRTLLVVRKPPASPRVRGPAPRPRAAGPGGPPKQTDVEPEPLRLEERVEVHEQPGDAAGHPAAYSMDARRIHETAGTFDDVLQTLRVLPGVAAINDKDAKLAVRGGGPEHNLVVLDGVQIPNPFRFGEFNSSFLNPDTAARVTLDASGLDAAHGGRLSSVTAIETRDGTRDRRLTASGSLGLASGDLLLEGRLPGSASGSWWMAARGTYYQPLMDGFRRGQFPGFGDLQFKAAMRPAERTKVAFLGLISRETMKQQDFDEEDGGAVTHYTGRHHLGLMTLTWTPDARLAATTTVSFYDHTARDVDVLGFLLESPFDRQVGVRDVAVRQQAFYALSRSHTIDAGGELHRVHSSWRMAGVKLPIFWRGIGPSTWGEGIEYAPELPIDSALTRTQVGAWLQDRFAIAPHVTLEPGIRLDYNSFTGESAWQPRVRAAVRFGSNTAWAGYAAQVQTPAHESLQGFDYFHLTPRDGARLRNERLRQVVAGFERPLGGGVSIRIEAYRRTFDRLLVQRLETDEERARRLARFLIPADLPADDVILERRPTVFPESTGRGTADGVELFARRSGGRLQGWLGYTFSRTQREMYGYSFPFDFDRPHALNGSLTLSLSSRLRAGVTFFLTSGFPVTPLHEEVLFLRSPGADGTLDPVARPARNQDGTFWMAPNVAMRRLALRNSDRLSPYGRADVRVTYATLGHWEFYGEVINALGTRNFLQEMPVPSQLAGQPAVSTANNIYESFERFPSFGIRFRF